MSYDQFWLKDANQSDNWLSNRDVSSRDYFRQTWTDFINKAISWHFQLAEIARLMNFSSLSAAAKQESSTIPILRNGNHFRTDKKKGADFRKFHFMALPAG